MKKGKIDDHNIGHDINGLCGLSQKLRAGASGVALTFVLGAMPTNANAQLVSACSGVSLPPSVVTGILSSVLTPIFNLPIVSVLGLGPILTSISAGNPIGLNVLDLDGNTVLSNAQCNTTSDSFALDTPKGISIGGNQITGLGTGAAGQEASAATLDGIAFGNAARANTAGSIAIGQNARVNLPILVTALNDGQGGTAIGQNSSVTGGSFTRPSTAIGYNARTTGVSATALGGNASALVDGATAVGSDSTVTVANGVALGASSSASTAGGVTGLVPTGSAVADAARVVATNSTAGFGAVSLGDTGIRRQITNVAAGTQDSDAVNVSQLAAVGNQVTATALVVNNSVLYDDAAKARITLAGGVSGTTITNVTAGALTETSTDAVNGSQLFATNQTITNVTNNIDNGTVGVVRQVGGSPGTGQITVGAQTGGTSVSFAGTSGNRVLSGVAAGTAATDAVNVDQLTSVALVAGNSVQYDGPTKASITLGGGASGTTIANVKAGTLAATSTDAVNGGQLFATNQTISNITNNIDNGTIGLVRQAGGSPGAGQITVGAQTGGTSVSFTGTSGNRVLSGVAAGTAATDAVNVDQLASVALVAGNSVQYDDSTKASITLGGVGGTTIANVKAGALTTTSTDAVNGSQLTATNTNVTNLGNSTATSLGGGSTYNSTTGTISSPTYAVQGGSYNNVGDAFTAVDAQVTSNTTNIDALTQNISNGSIGLVQQTGGAPGSGPITIGALTGGTSINLAGASGDRVVSGVAAGVAGSDAVNVTQLTNAILGATGNSVQYDNSSRTSLTLNAGGASTTVSNVAAGAVTATSTDAVNGSQLYTTNQQVATNTTNITAINNGAAGAFRSNNSSGLAQPDATGTDAVAGGFGAVASGAGATALGAASSATGANSVALGYRSSDDGRSNVVSVGSTGAERQITNVAAGTRATDAINLGQLNSGLAGAISYTDSRFAALNFDLRNARRDASAGTASAMAAAGLPQAFTPGAGMIAGGMSVYRDQTAFAIGASKIFNDGHTIVKGGATYTDRSSTFGANVGVGYQF